jgi:hypothetical protein
MWMVVVNVVNKQLETVDKGGPPLLDWGGVNFPVL